MQSRLSLLFSARIAFVDCIEQLLYLVKNPGNCPFLEKLQRTRVKTTNNEQPEFEITANNYQQYQDKLTPS